MLTTTHNIETSPTANIFTGRKCVKIAGERATESVGLPSSSAPTIVTVTETDTDAALAPTRTLTPAAMSSAPIRPTASKSLALRGVAASQGHGAGIEKLNKSLASNTGGRNKKSKNSSNSVKTKAISKLSSNPARLLSSRPGALIPTPVRRVAGLQALSLCASPINMSSGEFSDKPSSISASILAASFREKSNHLVSSAGKIGAAFTSPKDNSTANTATQERMMTDEPKTKMLIKEDNFMSIAASTPTIKYFKNLLDDKRTFDISADTLDSLHHCKLPRSMLDLFSKQVELLTGMIDDFETNVVKRLDARTVSPPATQAIDDLLRKLTMQITSLEEKIDKPSSKIADMENDFEKSAT